MQIENVPCCRLQRLHALPQHQHIELKRTLATAASHIQESGWVGSQSLAWLPPSAASATVAAWTLRSQEASACSVQLHTHDLLIRLPCVFPTHAGSTLLYAIMLIVLLVASTFLLALIAFGVFSLPISTPNATITAGGDAETADAHAHSCTRRVLG
jgi:hypothetical protein